MADPDSTCWTLIRDAARGDEGARAEFARCYEPIVRACLGARWRLSPLRQEIDDATQETLLVLCGDRSPLGRADPERARGFRAYLRGVVRNVAREFERCANRRRERQPDDRMDLGQVETDEETLSHAFDRAWARSLLAQAARRQLEQAQAAGERAERRVEILRLRIGEDVPIREMAGRWGEDAAVLHREYALAREEFKRCLRAVVREHREDDGRSVEAECRRLLSFFV